MSHDCLANTPIHTYKMAQCLKISQKVSFCNIFLHIFLRFCYFLAQKLKHETILKHCMFEISVLQKVMNVKNAVGVGKIVNEPPP